MFVSAASVYFRNPDGHMLEYLSTLDKEPRPDLGIISWSEWTERDVQERKTNYFVCGVH